MKMLLSAALSFVIGTLCLFLWQCGSEPSSTPTLQSQGGSPICCDVKPPPSPPPPPITSEEREATERLLKYERDSNLQRSLNTSRITAHQLYENRRYYDAIAECDRMLEKSPADAEVLELRKQITETLRLLGMSPPQQADVDVQRPTAHPSFGSGSI